MKGVGAASKTTQLGARGESAAEARYVQMGCELVARNWTCSFGELDLVVEHDGVLIFCEVKTRTGVSLGAGFEAVTGDKQRRIRRLADVFVLRSRWTGPVRFDVASVAARSGHVEVQLFMDAF